MLTYWEILTAIQSNAPVNDSYAQLWGRKAQDNYTVTTYTGTLPAALTGTKAGYLHLYKIYGNTEQIGTPTPENPIMPQECGERTENLFDEEYPDIRYTVQYRALNLGKGMYTLSSTVEISQESAGTLFFLTGNVSSGASTATNAVYKDRPITVTSTDGYVTIAYRIYTTDTPVGKETMLNLGSTALPYEPYGYKLPLTAAGQDVDIYIGDDTLSTDEYVDSGTGKIYRMVSGTLTPVDPPVPFPQIPTSAGSTIISWAGEGLAPSKVELEYEKKR